MVIMRSTPRNVQADALDHHGVLEGVGGGGRKRRGGPYPARGVGVIEIPEGDPAEMEQVRASLSPLHSP